MPRLLSILLASLLLLLVQTSVHGAGFTQAYQATGTLRIECGGAANLNLPASGTITLPSPPSGIIKKAFLYATTTGATNSLNATFGGIPLGGMGQYDIESLLLTIRSYRWDVTNFIVPGVSSYTVTILDGANQHVFIPGVALAVVWDDVSEPTRTITIRDGIRQVGESGAETESMTFASLPAGSTTVWVFTTDDDNSLGEVISYNGNNIGGPLVGNLGLNASVVSMSGTSVSGSNTLSISTTTDHFSWVFGATSVDLPPVGVEKTSMGRIKSLYR